MRPMFFVGLAMGTWLGATQILDAQVPTTSSALPLEVLDSTYAVRLELERVADMIRQGRLDARRMRSREAETALLGLREIALSRRAKPQHPGLGPLWDFAFQDIKLEVAAADRIMVSARALLATDPQGGRDVTLAFVRQPDGRWKVRDHHGLVPFLAGQTKRLVPAEAK